MTKKDLFVVIYCTVWCSISVILLFINNFITQWVDSATFVFIANSIFLLVTSTFVFIKPVGKWVDKYIIDKMS